MLIRALSLLRRQGKTIFQLVADSTLSGFPTCHHVFVRGGRCANEPRKFSIVLLLQIFGSHCDSNKLEGDHFHQTKKRWKNNLAPTFRWRASFAPPGYRSTDSPAFNKRNMFLGVTGTAPSLAMKSPTLSLIDADGVEFSSSRDV